MGRRDYDEYENNGRRSNHGFIAGMLGIIASACVCIIILFSVAQLLFFPLGKTWFRHEFGKYSVLEDVRGEMSMESAVGVLTETMDYLIGKRDDLEVTTTIDGQRQPFFSEREKTHMADCRVLVQKMIIIRRVAIVLAVVLFLAIKVLRRERAKRTIVNTYVVTSIASIAGLGFLWYKASNDFDTFFEKFHKIFFDNNLYVLDPAKDNLINLLPEGFFSDTAIAIAVLYLFATMALLLLAKKV